MRDKEENEHLHQIRKCVEKDSFIFILEKRLDELRLDIEDINLDEKNTNAVRGGIVEIRNLLDLIQDISSRVD